MRKTRAAEFRRAAQMAAMGATDIQALDMPSLYPQWDTGVGYGGDGVKIARHGGALYRCIQAHVSQADWTPETAHSLWERIDAAHAGTPEDPIPAALNMQYAAGKYYTEAGRLYRCTRDSGIALAYLPSQLVGQYFEEVV